MAGYIGSQTPVVSNGSQRKYTFTATAAQTVFTGMDIPNPQQIQVFQNGVRLVITTDYTVSSGTTVTLVNAASAGDSLVVILFADYQLLDTDALTFTGGTTIEGGLTVDNDGATVLTVDRASTDGTIVDLQKDGTSVGGIGAQSGKLQINGTSGTGLFLDTVQILPKVNGSLADNQVDLGSTGYRFNELWLGGGVYLGGTGSANHLDDYEEGTWTPSVGGATTDPTVTYTTQAGFYVKIGRMVHISMYLNCSAVSGGSGAAKINGIPFNMNNAGSYFAGSQMEIFGLNVPSNMNNAVLRANGNSGHFRLEFVNTQASSTGGTGIGVATGSLANNFRVLGSLTYMTS